MLDRPEHSPELHIRFAALLIVYVGLMTGLAPAAEIEPTWESMAEKY